jgi:diaminohydroxyphosphoribosylaminopyrimidine deaminase/5-amino-6-(5-phosphoribosylamino)uracil reductase
VHKWRSEEMAILVGTNTALFDDPSLTTRLWPGINPIRIVVDMNLRLPQSLKLFDGKTPTIIFNLHRHTLPFEKISATDLRAIGVGYYQVTEDANLVHQMLNALYLMNIQSVMVEGGAQLLQSFIDDGSWDEARIITNENLIIGNGLPSPVLKDNQLTSTQNIAADAIRIYHQTVK